MNIDEFLIKARDWLVDDGIATGSRLLVIIVITLLAIKGARMLTRRLIAMFTKNGDVEVQKRADTLIAITSLALTIGIVAIAGITILGEVGIDIKPILATAGVVGVAVGFGAQSLVKDVISGFFILLEDQIRVGDVVQIAGKAGLVERVTLRMVVLRDLGANVHYVPNGIIDTVTNMTKEYSSYVFEIGIAYREDVDHVIGVIKEVDEEMRADPDFGPDILAPMEIFGLDKFADSAVVIKTRFKTAPIKQWGIGREFNRRLKKRFDELDIEIPFPHLTFYPGKDKDGTAPQLHVSMEDGTAANQDGG